MVGWKSRNDGIRNMEYGIWNKFGIWNIEYRKIIDANKFLKSEKSHISRETTLPHY